MKGHDCSELLKEVVDLLNISMVDFAPEFQFTSYGLDSLGVTKMSQVVQPHACFSQMQLLEGHDS